MKKLILILISIPLWAQQKQPVSSLQEDCGATFAFTAQSSGAQAAGNTTTGSTGTTPVIDNRQAGCLDWVVAYSTTTTVTGISLTFQTATDVAGVPGTWSNYPGTLTSGINPNTAVTPGGAVTVATGPKYPFLRMNLTSLTGTGTVSGKLYGWKQKPSNVTIVSGGGCPGTVGTPCVVVGPAASGTAKAGAPVQTGAVFNTTQPTVTTGQVVENQATARGALIVAPGVDPFSVTACPGGTPCVVVSNKSNNAVVPGATNLGVLPGIANAAAPTYTEGDQVLLSLDLSGNARVTGTVASTQTATSTAFADGLSNTEPLPTASAAAVNQRIFPQLFNGATWDRSFICNLSAPFNLSGSGSTQIIAASGSTIIRVCHVDFLTTAAVNVKIVQGTGANCVTSPVDLTGLYTGASAFSFAMDYAPTSALRSTASQAICVNQSGAVTTGGTVIYAQF